MRALRIAILSTVLATVGIVSTVHPVGGESTSVGVKGIASHYGYTAGFVGQATVALPGSLGGHYNGRINGYATVCADKCATLPIVDWCYCLVPESSQPYRVADLSDAAWPLVSSQPIAKGLISVTVYVNSKVPSKIPNTAFR